MPFDGRNPFCAVEILDTMEKRFSDGVHVWMQYPKAGSVPKGACLLDGLGQTILDLELGSGRHHDEVQALLASAIGCLSDSHFANQKAVEADNDAKGRTLDDIFAIIRKAKTLAQESVTALQKF
jgi:hypothetical protein